MRVPLTLVKNSRLQLIGSRLSKIDVRMWPYRRIGGTMRRIDCLSAVLRIPDLLGFLSSTCALRHLHDPSADRWFH